jgi:hypothetical protein
VRRVLMHDLVAVARRHRKRLDHGIVRSIEQLGDGFLVSSLDQVKTKYWHRVLQIIVVAVDAGSG